MPEGFNPNYEPPIDPLDDANPIDLSSEPPIAPDDTNPSKSQLMEAIDLSAEPPIAPDDTNPSISQSMPIVDLSNEPMITPDDTSPSGIMPREQVIPAWRRLVGVIALLGALGLTIAASVMMFAPQPDDAVIVGDAASAVGIITEEAVQTDMPTDTPTEIATEVVGVAADTTATNNPLPTLNPAQISTILQQAPDNRVNNNPLQIIRNPFEPFTLIPDRPRSEVLSYTIERGDTITSIAEKFGLTPESLVWGNSRDIVGILNPGQTINIVPENGVLHLHTGSATIADIAAQYGIDEPYQLIDSEYNPELRGLSPDSVPPSGARIMVVNGVAEQISWNPTVEREGGGSGGSGGGFITFAPGDPGSCGRIANPGGGAFWSNPLSSYTWMRGFSTYHTGVDLAAAVGTPVSAANSGRVIFAGWNSWGYGYTVVLAHGPFTTLYGHMSAVYVGCGQDIGAGTSVGAVGNTGNSSGPHLHFEIRYNDQPQDPTISVGF